MSQYRDDLDAARRRIETLEAQIRERQAALEAREVELAEREAELARIRQGYRSPDKPRPRIALACLLIGLVVSTAIVSTALIRSRSTCRSSLVLAAPVPTATEPRREPPPTRSDAHPLDDLMPGGLLTDERRVELDRDCWTPAVAARAPDQATRAHSAQIEIMIMVTPSGRVKSGAAMGAEEEYPALASCVAEKIKKWKLGSSDRRQNTKVGMPITFPVSATTR
jgi:hypothetical protein